MSAKLAEILGDVGTRIAIVAASEFFMARWLAARPADGAASGRPAAVSGAAPAAAVVGAGCTI